jgi:hypothetical protein
MDAQHSSAMALPPSLTSCIKCSSCAGRRPLISDAEHEQPLCQVVKDHHDGKLTWQLITIGLLFAAAPSCHAAFILACTWLAYTTSPKARSRASCCGNYTPCTNYTCDLTWDILLLIFWVVMLGIVAAGLSLFDFLIKIIQDSSEAFFILGDGEAKFIDLIKDLTQEQKAVAAAVAKEHRL